MKQIVDEVTYLAESVGWTIDHIKIALTGSVYIDIRRDNEWAQIRVSDHKQVYCRWLITYSIAPGDLWFEDLEEILTKPYGEVGDIL